MAETRSFGFIVAAAILAVGLIAGGWVLGNGLVRARYADRAVTVRGLAERDVVADLATWTLTPTATGSELVAVQAQAVRDRAATLAFLKSRRFGDDEIETGGISLNQYVDGNGRANITIRQRILLRTLKVMAARKAFGEQAELLQQGVAIDSDNGGIVYSFTRLNDVKPPMIAAATKNARAGAEQFAADSGTGVGGIRSAQQGLFSIIPRDGDTGATASASPYQKVRVVTTIDFYLE